MNVWRKNLVAAAILVVVCAGIYINWLYTEDQATVSIVDTLNIMEAPVALMKLENIRILKEMRNSVNRRVNCEAANINKTVTAAQKQIEDIQYIKDAGGFGDLSPSLLATAELRLAHPDVSLKELGTMLNPPVGKSGVNHRLRRLSEIAEKLRGKYEV